MTNDKLLEIINKLVHDFEDKAYHPAYATGYRQCLDDLIVLVKEEYDKN